MQEHRHPRITAVLKLGDGRLGLCVDVIDLTPEEATLLGSQLIEKAKEAAIIRPPSLEVVR